METLKVISKIKIYFLIIFLVRIIPLSSSDNAKPLVSILTSVWKGDEFIEHFLMDIVRQTIFKKCELIMINANSPGNEELIIKKYMIEHPNIIYKKLSYDPGLYGVWNIAIGIAQADFLVNANLDDRMAPNFLEIHANALINNPYVDLVYSDSYWTNKPNETFEHNSATGFYPFGRPSPEFSREKISRNAALAGCHPMWRKILHEKHGLFDSSFFAIGDLDMWIRAIKGDAIFKKVHGVYGLYYTNPNGLSTAGHIMVNNGHYPDPKITSSDIIERRKRIRVEHGRIFQKYKEFFKKSYNEPRNSDQ